MNLLIKKTVSLFVLVLCSLAIQAQELKFEKTEKLGDHINSTAEEISPLLTPDGKTLYFARVFHPDNNGGKIAGLDIWRSDKTAEGEWTPATNKFKQWNTKGSNAVIGINKNGTVIYLLNSYNKKSGIAFSKLLNGEWTSPETIVIPGMERSEFVGYYMNPTFDILLISMNDKDSFGQEDLYVSIKGPGEKWSTPLNLGSTINTEGFEIAPYLSEDGKKIYFSSNGHAGLGDADIFVSERLYESWTVWSKPKNLGKPINSEKFDAYFTLHNDTICTFSSNRDAEFSDIYQSIFKQQTILKDSINKIVQETQQLLSGLKVNDADNKDKAEFVSFDLNSSTVSAHVKDQVNAVLRKHNTKLLKSIEITAFANDSTTPSINYSIALNRSKNVLEYIQLQTGVAKEKLKTKTSNEVAKGKNGVEIKVVY